MRLPALACLFLGTLAAGRATTLPPELKAYDFAQAYYVEDGGVVVVPYDRGFLCSGGVETPEGIRIMPGTSFVQLDPDHLICEEYRLERLNAEQTRAFFHERRFRYQVVTGADGKAHFRREAYLGSDNFYLSQWRRLEWFDFAFPNLALHPGEQAWRTRQL